MTLELATREPSSLVQVHDQCDAVEAAAAESTSIPEIQDWANRLAAIDEYLLRTSKDGRARVAAAMRRLELRIGDLLGPAEHGGDRGNQHTGGKCQVAHEQLGMEPRRIHEFRRFAANRDIVEATIANSDDKAPPTRRAVILAIAEANKAKAAELRDQGLTHAEIADRLHIHTTVVGKLLGPQPKPEPARSDFHRRAHHIKTERIVEQTFYALDGLAIGFKQADIDGLDPAYAAEWADHLHDALGPIARFIGALQKRSKA